MTIGVIGGSGLIGRHLVAECCRLQLPVRCIDRQPPRSPIPPEVFHECDIRFPDATRVALRDCHAVFMKAALLGEPRRSTDPNCSQEFLETNVRGLNNVLDACLANGVSTLIFDSSITVFGKDPPAGAFTEDTIPAPCNIYGASKLIGESLVRLHCAQHKMRCVIFRYVRVRNAATNDVIRGFCQCVKQGVPIRLTGNPGKVIEFVHVDDVVTSNLLALSAATEAGTFHIGTAEPVSVAALAERVTLIANAPTHPIELIGTTRPDFEPSRNTILYGLAEARLGYRPSRTLNWMIEETMQDTGL